MEKIVNEFIKHPLSDADIMNICNGKANLVLNSNLYKYKTLDKLTYPYGACILLYDKDDGSPGHWCCITKNKYGYEYFDSYGYYPDYVLQQIGGKSYLLNIISNTKENVYYNKTKLQKSRSNVSTCGRYVGMRVLLKDMPLHKFTGMLTKNKYYDADYYITILTLFAEN